jgi:CubicO group peptidase (beta-lactamase class C family)
MKKTIAAVLTAGCVLAAFPSFSSALSQADAPKTLADFRDIFIKKLADAGIVGGSLAVLGSDRDLLDVHYGWADLERLMPPDEETIYDWGSITKLLTCIAIMQLDDQAILQIDDPVVKYIPAFRNVKNPFNNTETITLRMLMSHASGLQEGSFLIPLDWDMDWPVWEQIEPNFNYLRVEREPGSSYGYSNLGTMILGRVIEVVTKDSYEVYIDKNIFKPLEMHQSYFDTTPRHLKKHKARSYHAAKEGESHIAYGPDVDQGFTTTNGGWKCSVGDFKKFVRFLLGSRDQAVQDRYDGVLPRELLESMWIPRLTTDQPGMSIGLEFLVIPLGSSTFIGHSGGANGFTSNVTIHLDSMTGFFMAGNTDGFTAVMKAFRDSLMVYLAEARPQPEAR